MSFTFVGFWIYSFYAVMWFKHKDTNNLDSVFENTVGFYALHLPIVGKPPTGIGWNVRGVWSSC